MSAETGGVSPSEPTRLPNGLYVDELIHQESESDSESIADRSPETIATGRDPELMTASAGESAGDDDLRRAATAFTEPIGGTLGDADDPTADDPFAALAEADPTESEI